jgi:hypothetical protein
MVSHNFAKLNSSALVCLLPHSFARCTASLETKPYLILLNLVLHVRLQHGVYVYAFHLYVSFTGLMIMYQPLEMLIPFQST